MTVKKERGRCAGRAWEKRGNEKAQVRVELGFELEGWRWFALGC